ncbi:cytochrome c oxidase subunit 3 family protein [Vulgatibacter sp.]|uniref:cytochrome c oxidase subunit 3 family protein n=1 Tax=Vulgatibacter sp. TaxID=1971226 RepID=UPI0035670A25
MSTPSASIPSNVQRHQVGHHFANAEQEFSSAKLGFWLFLCTELLMFGGLFVGFIYYRTFLAETFLAAHRTLSIPLGTVNTVVLITSSFTMAMAIRCAMVNKQKQMMAFLWVTLLCAGAFMVIKLGFEWPSKFAHHTLPGRYFDLAHAVEAYPFLEGLASPHIFYSLYFMMTGLHGIHVVIGMGLITWLIWRGYKGHFYSGFYTPLEMTGLYWHLVDLIWIFLFPLFYLVG